MRVLIQQFLFGKSYSWSVVSQNIGRSLIKLGHDVDFVSTDGFDEKYCPSDLRPFVKEQPNGTYDMAISYTAPPNWKHYLAPAKHKLAIWNYEYKLQKGASTIFLPGFAKNHNFANFLMPSSNFAKDVFLDIGFPEEKIRVVPHGFDVEAFKTENVYKLKTNKKTKILLNINQPHKRKNLSGALEMFGKAFSKKDDVCLVAKVYTKNKKGHSFDVDFFKILNSFKKKYPNHAEIEVVQDYIENIADLYNACDVNFSATHAECFYLPALEAFASGLVNVVPNYGGQLDFCNEDNSLLISGEEVRAPKDHLYWHPNPFAVHFKPNINDGAAKLREAVNNYGSIKKKFEPNVKNITDRYTWENVANMILEL